jgi:3-oxoacyl-[acyl-carrier-protein] synthase II
MALDGEWIPPTMTIDTPDPLCSFNLVRAPTDARFDYALSNSFGFGGANASLILRKWS